MCVAWHGNPQTPFNPNLFAWFGCRIILETDAQMVASRVTMRDADGEGSVVQTSHAKVRGGEFAQRQVSRLA